MNIKEAAHTLDTFLRPYSWFGAVGVAEPPGHKGHLVIYLNAPEQITLPTVWEGYRVIAYVTGQMVARPAMKGE